MAPINVFAYAGDIDTHFRKGEDEITEDGILTVSKKEYAISHNKDFLPTWDPSQKYPPLKFHEHHDRGVFADPALPNLLPKGIATTRDVTPKLGTEVFGVQLSELDDAGKDELALFVAQRGVTIFRDQNFGSKGPAFAVDYGRYFGKLHIHPTSGAPKGFPELHITYRRADPEEFSKAFAKKNSNVTWHTDVSYELQPPATTFFSVLEGPPTGGDTIFADTVEAYNRLSPTFKEMIKDLKVLHTSEDQAGNSRSNGGIERRKPVSSIHPLVRIHPVTKQKALYLNRSFSRKIVGLKEEESDALMSFLFNHIESAADLQLRARWEPNSVVVWDNRRVVHSAILDWDSPVSRHAFRVTPQGERPVAELADLNREDYLSDI